MKIEELRRCLDEIDEVSISTLEDLVDVHESIIILGNGGSNSIASHISQDYTKKLGKRAIAFSDPSRLTCYINDYGMENAYVKFLEHFAQPGHLIILISSSGGSPNILNAAEHCLRSSLPMITLSGFSETNMLRTKYGNDSLVHFWVDSSDYGVVENIHQIILHTPA
jgi:D-sedoheptulose 7-phosphate isomerase